MRHGLKKEIKETQSYQVALLRHELVPKVASAAPAILYLL
jgi:hypothetical protein